jgi:hypothetical protein
VDVTILAALAGAVVLVLAIVGALFYAPARTSILIDTRGAIARADMKLLWGVGPAWTLRALPKELAGNPLAAFYDPARVGYALMTPGIADTTYAALRRLFAHNPSHARFDLGVNLADAAQARVVETAIQAVLASAPANVRQAIAITKCETPGAELVSRFDLNISPTALNGIYGRFKKSRAVKEFHKRLKRKPKANRKAPREVRAS